MRSSSRPCGCEEDARFGASTNGLQTGDCRGGEGHPRGVAQEEREREKDMDTAGRRCRWVGEVEGNDGALAR